ncbi:MAG: trehalose-6-phosphate synthase [Dehalococcoidales bacterium]|jgi:trehalose 6-phosphate synthase
MWTRESLGQLVKEKLSRYLLVVVSNREPYVHTLAGDKITWHQPVGGLTEALDPVLRSSGGTWVAQGSGDADRKVVDAADRVAVPPDRPEYTLRRVWLTQEEVNGYYLGFANEGLWPLCHTTSVPPVFRDGDWLTYKKVNRIFADAVAQEIGGRRALVLVQDYHFALLASYIRAQNPGLTIGQFWHIPWPSFKVLRTCPWYGEILAGLLGNDLLGFHTPSYCRNFKESVEDAAVNGATAVEAFPISVDFRKISGDAAAPEVEREMDSLRREFNLEGKYVGIGMDRLDYTKGIPERLQALDRFLEDNSRYLGRVVFIQAGMPSRTQVGIYEQLDRRVDELIRGLNQKYGTASWQPVIPLMRQLTPVTLNALRRLAHFCVVSSLHDGMNLVAKEYVAARTDDDGVLILSKFTGAAEELAEAVFIDPRVIGEFAGKIKEAIEMPEEERRRRMSALRRTVAENNIYKWGASMLSRLAAIAEEK